MKPKQIEKKFNLEENSFHPGGKRGIKNDIIRDGKRMNPAEMKRLGNNPDVIFRNDGRIAFQSTQFKGRSWLPDKVINIKWWAK